MTKESIIKRVYEIIYQIEGLKNLDKLQDDTWLFEECGLDSASVIELVVLLEEEFGFEYDAASLDLRKFANINRISDNIMLRLGMNG